MPPIDEIMTFAAANRVAYMATADGDKPRVHAFDMWKVDPSGFYFHNNASAGVYNQILNNQNVELLFRSPSGNQGLRVVGKAELLADAALAAAYYGTSGKGIFMGKGKPSLAGKPAMFRVTGQAWLRQPNKGKHDKGVIPVVEATFG